MRSPFAILAPMARAPAFSVDPRTPVVSEVLCGFRSSRWAFYAVPLRFIYRPNLRGLACCVCAQFTHTPLMRCLNSLAGERSSFKRPIMNEAIQIIQTLNSNPPHPPPYPLVKGLFWPLAVMSESASFENKLRERRSWILELCTMGLNLNTMPICQPGLTKGKMNAFRISSAHYIF